MQHDVSAMSKTTRALVLLFSIVCLGLIPPVREAMVRGLYLLALGRLGEFHTFLLSLGPWAPIVSVVLMTIQSIAIPIPVTLVMVANGVAFGVLRGMLVSFAGGMLGAMAAYYIGRRLGRVVVERFVPRPVLKSADKLMAAKGAAWAIVLGRWVPGVPCDPLSYAAGIMKMPIVPFTLLTIAGLIPANLATAFVGAEVTGDIQTSYWLIGLAVVGALLLVWKYVNRVRTGAGSVNARKRAS
jgi:uncharacterized membrane protein YdjX (TVP38/TMEM64 family)